MLKSQFRVCLSAAIHNWHGNVPHGLELDVGDSVEILEEYGPWLRGTCPRKPRSVGLFPRTYIHVKDTSRADAIVTECTQVLREWSETWKKLFVVWFSSKYFKCGDTVLVTVCFSNRNAMRTSTRICEK